MELIGKFDENNTRFGEYGVRFLLFQTVAVKQMETTSRTMRDLCETVNNVHR